MHQYVFYVKFQPESTRAAHFLTVEEITVKAVSEHANMAAMNAEVYMFLAAQYPDREVKSVQGFAR